jgi:hypothetical protein
LPPKNFFLIFLLFEKMVPNFCVVKYTYKKVFLKNCQNKSKKNLLKFILIKHSYLKNPFFF